MNAQTAGAARALVKEHISFGVFNRYPRHVEKMRTVLTSYLLFEPALIKQLLRRGCSPRREQAKRKVQQMTKALHIFLVCLVLVFSGTQAQAAKSVYCVNCSTSLIQKLQEGIEKSQLARLIAQYKEAVKQTAYQLQMVQTQIAQYKTMIQNTLQLPAALVGEVVGTFAELAEVTGQLNTLRGDLTSLGSMFTELYPDYTSLKALADARTPEDIAKAIAQYQTHWANWSQDVDRASEATFKLSGVQLEAMRQDSTRFREHINKLLEKPEGQMQALTAGNKLTALQVEEIRQLRELIATNIQSDLAASEKAEKESQMEREAWRKFMSIDRR